MKILILNDFPTFEAKYLKNYLAEKGHQVVSRSGLTRGRFKYEYFNMETRPPIGFTSEELSAFDLLIVDAISLRNLSRARRNALERSVREKGLGVFIQADNAVYASTVPLNGFQFDRTKGVQATLDDFPRIKISMYPFTFTDTFSLQPIHTSDTKILSGYQRLGGGRVGTSVLQNTYELVLNGNSEVYQQFWAKILESIAKSEEPRAMWKSDAMISFPNEPFTFQLRTQEPAPTVTSGEGFNIAMRQDYDSSSHKYPILNRKTIPNHSGLIGFNVLAPLYSVVAVS